MYYFEVICLVLLINTVFLMLRLRKWIRIATANRDKYNACNFVKGVYRATLLRETTFTGYSVACEVQETANVCGDAPEGWQDEY